MSTQPPSNPEVSFEDRVAFVLNELPRERQATIAAALAGNESLRGAIEAIRRIVDSLRTEAQWRAREGLVEQVRRLFDAAPLALPAGFDSNVGAVVAELVADTRDLQELAGYRGALAAYQLSFEARGIEVHLQISPVSTPEGERCLVQGELIAEQATGSASIAFAPVGGGEPAARCDADETGYFKAVLEPGTYTLVARVGDVTMVVPAVEVG